ncbi:MAG: hypothetical protein Kow00105_19840 [Phycisphaeraceae bacterium]
MSASTQALVFCLTVMGAVVVFRVLTAPHPVSSGRGIDRPIPTHTKIDPNTDEPAMLRLLPGVGPGIAEHIVSAREDGRVFHRADDLLDVPFVGPRLVERIRPWTRFDHLKE